ncbi:MAG: penicillin-binding protein 1A [Nitrospiria bacterium]
MKWGIKIFLVFFLLSAIGTGGVIYHFSRDLPSLKSLGSYKPSQATRIYSDENRVIGEYYIEKRVFVPISRMPKHLVQAVLAVEDARFYEHKGFDPIRIIRAFQKNLESGRIRQGASTITQQLTRSLFLTPERTMERKIKELLLALKMEKVLSKDEILEIYLNHIYFGHGAYGVQIASKTYFGKNVTDITLEEAAFMAGLPKAPNDYSPYRHPEKAKFRQRIVLKRMVDEGYITERAYRGAYEKDLLFKKLHSGEDFALYFKEYVRQYLISRYGDDVVYKGGLNVYTSLNEEMQHMAEKALEEGLRRLDKRQGYRGPIGRYEAVETEVEPRRIRNAPLKTGTLLEGRVVSLHDDYATVEADGRLGKIMLEDMIWAARRLTGPDIRQDRTLIEDPKPADLLKIDDMVQVGVKAVEESSGSILFNLEQEPIVEGAFVSLDPADGTVKALVGGYDFNRSEFNRALSARRQPGSAFKPIIYGTAIDQGFTSATILIDNPVIFTDTDTHRVWKPENYEKKFYGPTTLRDALTYSRNLATVKLLRQIGIGNVSAFAKRIGIESSLTQDLSLALGSSGMGLLELTSALGVYANEGVRVDPALILSVTDSSGRILETRNVNPNRVLSKETAYVVTNILEDVVQRGTAKRARAIGRPIAGKTGTTNEFTDAWFIGYTPNLASGVWVGFDDNRSLGYKESGGRAALPIWVSYMHEALSLLPVVPFSIPDDIVYTKVDRETGLLAQEGEGEYEIFVKGTEPTEVKQDFASPSEFFRFDQEIDAF